MPLHCNLTFMRVYSDHYINRTKLFLHQHLQAALPEQKELLPHTSQVADDLQYVHWTSKVLCKILIITFWCMHAHPPTNYAICYYVFVNIPNLIIKYISKLGLYQRSLVHHWIEHTLCMMYGPAQSSHPCRYINLWHENFFGSKKFKINTSTLINNKYFPNLPM